MRIGIQMDRMSKQSWARMRVSYKVQYVLRTGRWEVNWQYRLCDQCATTPLTLFTIWCKKLGVTWWTFTANNRFTTGTRTMRETAGATPRQNGLPTADAAHPFFWWFKSTIQLQTINVRAAPRRVPQMEHHWNKLLYTIRYIVVNYSRVVFNVLK